jgi:hypothetical protein
MKRGMKSMANRTIADRGAISALPLREDVDLVQQKWSFFWLFRGEQLQLKEDLRKVGLMTREEERAIMSMDNPLVEWGREEGSLDLVLRQLRKQFGPLDPEEEKLIGKLPLEKLNDLGEALLDFKSERDLKRWLSQLPPNGQ